ncbi:hypothetical protein M408DRAFT_28343 [Serendipita vermifera MAFF 305830]|uniref:Zn(2)-C6 fungal-type domain-containing protein n=1 Tax=Serendipita vermifera MAFF 305830 TaxID=933852 RepID=A0A0C3AUE1_SERVB|nr:hypothetical protein M408DRAFT_28343 [Serendipita vermifera MAFF 305830]
MLQIKEDNDDLIPTFSDHEVEMLGSSKDRPIRKRSSKACDQCRRSKSKCLRVNDQPCQSCAMLGVECTFLGPSRKRGPAKGYLTDLELKLHQMEALLGVVLASSDPRATSLVAAISNDSVARDVLTRVDSSPVGTQPHHTTQEVYNPRNGGGTSSVGKRIASELAESTREWQRHLLQIIANNPNPDIAGSSHLAGVGGAGQTSEVWGTHHSQFQDNSPQAYSSPHAPRPIRPPVALDFQRNASRSCSPSRRRRGVDPLTPQTAGSPGVHGGSSGGGPSDGKRDASSIIHSGRETPDYTDSEDLHDTMGQLSLDDASQLRYHGKASGLHLLGQTERVDRRAENGIWNFPPARIWPPTEKPIEKARALFASDFGVTLPPREHQRILLDIFFTYVNPSFPLFDRASFMKAWTFGVEESTEAQPDATFIPSRLPTPLMLVIYSIAIRFASEGAGVPEGTMSTYGDEYLSAAKYMMTANPYAASRPATCQAYLLIAYREIGIGAMSQAWLFLGVAIRMAQDLGLHRSVDKFHTVAANLFPPAEKEARNRVWGCCLVLDRSAYSLSLIPSMLGQVVEALYSVKQMVHSRHQEALKLEEQLETFYLDLPTYLKYDAANPSTPVPPPHVLTLNMQYWNTVLLVHRPFIQRLFNNRRDTPDGMGSPADSETLRNSSVRALELCKVSAGQVSDLAHSYQKAFGLLHCPSFMVYYIFNSAIMHVVALNHDPDEAATAGSARHLQQCMDALKGMAKLWPAASRGWELINGCRTEVRRAPVINIQQSHFARASSAVEPGGQQQQIPQQQQQPFPANRMLSHSRSLSHVRGDTRAGMTPSPLGDRLIHHKSQIFPSSVYQPTPPSATFATPYNLQNDPTRSSIPGWGFGSTSSPSGAHSRSTSVGSLREQVNTNPGAPMPHFWSDPFTDSTILTSNYYGVPILDRQTQIAIDHNAQGGFGPVDFTPYESGTF